MIMSWVIKRGAVFWPSKEMKAHAWVSDECVYKKEPFGFWKEQAKEIDWFEKWETTYKYKKPYFSWFVNGKLNVSYNCVDRHRSKKPAIIWVPEPVDEEPRIITYEDLYNHVNMVANMLKWADVRRGDRVVIYLPMIPETLVTMLACTRIGAIHSVVFSAFSPESLKQRIDDCQPKIIVTADGYYRRGKRILLKHNVDKINNDKKVFVFRRLNVKLKQTRNDFYIDDLDASKSCKPAKMKSQDPLFILYTSGTTGKPKGIVHDTGGYLVQAHATSKLIFNLHRDDVFWCTADIGWVTGHTYGCYGPLSTGSTILMYEGAPDYPNINRWWNIIEEFGVTVFYTAPTAIRMFMKTKIKHKLSSLRVLGTVGEVIDKFTWLWYFRNIGKSRCPVLNTWWQTETGGILISPLPGIGPFKPGFVGKSFPGTLHVIVNDKGNKLPSGKQGYLVQKPPFPPGMLHGIWKGRKKYIEEYWKKFDFKYFYTGDGALIDRNGNFKITGRVDDVMKIAGHRISSSEIEDAINRHKNVIESAVVPIKDKIKGQLPIVFAVLKTDHKNMKEEIVKTIIKFIGPIAKPKEIQFVDELPKTRSGKIMRRVLRKLVNNEKDLGNLSTLMNPDSVIKIKKILKYR